MRIQFLICEDGDTIVKQRVQKRMLLLRLRTSKVTIEELNRSTEVGRRCSFATCKLDVPREIDIRLDLELRTVEIFGDFVSFRVRKKRTQAFFLIDEVSSSV